MKKGFSILLSSMVSLALLASMAFGSEGPVASGPFDLAFTGRKGMEITEATFEKGLSLAGMGIEYSVSESTTLDFGFRSVTTPGPELERIIQEDFATYRQDRNFLIGLTKIF